MRSKISQISQWLLIVILVSIVAGSISALFLGSLSFVTNLRSNHDIFIYLLPIGGLLIGLMYFYGSRGVEGGNNLLIKEMNAPKTTIHWKIVPLVFIGTITTHLFGGSAGREGTAVQMGGAIGDAITYFFKWTKKHRKRLLRMGVAAGFSGVFGTPLAGAIFAFELARDKKFNIQDSILVIMTSFGGHIFCIIWGVNHTTYPVKMFPEFSWTLLLLVIIAGLSFGVSAYVFAKFKQFFTQLFSKIQIPFLRPMIGGIILLLLFITFKIRPFLGLGIPEIQDAFMQQQFEFSFLIKILLTALTLGAGFKGGEATPLFFIGAMLGNTLFLFLPLPMDFLAALGFVAVFGAATNTPIASSLIGAELFGFEGLLYFTIANFFAYIISGNNSVYSDQQKLLKKKSLFSRK
ncbi:chloride channel protein [Brumimicrobium aurantiacum]|uniref:Chloride channel protein n=1 Tax=Brumimicrobium aurantiacum TaxID=1737063 RepID=A0A3E1F0B0_9FLAO|nr:chloride channel protein [Brumimicrobium aurantiacum]RFC55240.1 chloride channel protein [Brumimicrobium aurantiacum]